MMLYRARLPSHASTVSLVRRAIETVAREQGLEEERVQDMRTAVSEAVTNAVLYGSPPPDSEIDVRVERREDELCIVVCDEGPGMLPRSESQGLGLGLPIISTLTDTMQIVSRPDSLGTELRMLFKL